MNKRSYRHGRKPKLQSFRAVSMRTLQIVSGTLAAIGLRGILQMALLQTLLRRVMVLDVDRSLLRRFGVRAAR